MNYNDRKYAILNASEVDTIDFSKVMEDSVASLRYSLDDSQTFVKFIGDTPSFLSGKVIYTHEIMKTIILNGDDWFEEDEE
tara:strand:+ start:1029 stop:1271 length:243 start_codon:yes stop_codon:yes gene_type:complete